MVSIDTVYQKVLMFANKEQRGYVTPQEFNLFADQAQKEIFEQYFYDLNQLSRISSNNKEYSDIIDNLNEKIAIFETTGTITLDIFDNTNIYRLGTVYDSSNTEVEEVQANEILYLNKSPLTAPTDSRPVYVRTGENSITSYPAYATLNCNYIKVPVKPNWAYVVVGGKAMYDSTNVTNFELHPAEESELVYKILKFAGVSMKRDDIMKAGQGLDMAQLQLEKQ